MIEINAPIWNGGRPFVGLSKSRLKWEGYYTTVRILYKNKSTGLRQWPFDFGIKTSEAELYPIQTVRNNVTLHVIPLDKFHQIGD